MKEDNTLFHSLLGARLASAMEALSVAVLAALSVHLLGWQLEGE